MKRFFRYGNKGFTLIELLVVIAILGTLAAVVVLNVTKFMGEGESQANATDQANIQTAIAAYMYDNNGTPPASPITAGSTSSSVSAYLLSAPKCTYTVDQSTGAITSQVCP
ncbi:MAG: type II secretion system protein [Dehalococcoidia bacterium]|nr:type II secretion system protein [Dehalococcoidia bacterium]